MVRKKRIKTAFWLLLLTAFMGLSLFFYFNADRTVFWLHGYDFEWLPDEFEPKAINRNGEIVGFVERSEGPEMAVWSPTTSGYRFVDHAPRKSKFAGSISMSGNRKIIGSFIFDGDIAGFYIDERGERTVIGKSMVPTAANDRGTVVGYLIDDDGRHKPFLWDSIEGLRRLPGVVDGIATAISEDDWVVGWSNGRPMKPKLWKETSAIPIELPMGFSSGAAWDINERHEVLMILGDDQPFLWSEQQGFRPLRRPDGFEHVNILQLNDWGSVLLSAWENDARFMSRSGFLVGKDRLSKIPFPNRCDTHEYRMMNKNGWIVGTAEQRENRRSGSFGAFLIRPRS